MVREDSIETRDGFSEPSPGWRLAWPSALQSKRVCMPSCCAVYSDHAARAGLRPVHCISDTPAAGTTELVPLCGEESENVLFFPFGVFSYV